MLPVKAPCAYNFAVPLRIVLWQHVGDLRPLGDFSKEKWPAHVNTQTYDPTLVTRPQPPLLDMCICW